MTCKIRHFKEENLTFLSWETHYPSDKVQDTRRSKNHFLLDQPHSNNLECKYILTVFHSSKNIHLPHSICCLFKPSLCKRSRTELFSYIIGHMASACRETHRRYCNITIIGEKMMIGSILCQKTKTTCTTQSEYIVPDSCGGSWSLKGTSDGILRIIYWYGSRTSAPLYYLDCSPGKEEPVFWSLTDLVLIWKSGLWNHTSHRERD